MKEKEIIFVGWVNQGNPPVDGETTKNQYIIAELQKYCEVIILDFYQKNKHPWIYLQALWMLIAHPNATIILSTSPQNVYSMLKLFKAIGLKRDIIHWVVGGAFGQHVLNGKYEAGVFNYVRYNLVQCRGMIDELKKAGVTNARFVSNFKPIKYYPDLEKALALRKKSEKVRFVFISRIMPDKGCNYIMAAIKLLNDKGLAERFSVDFYGKIDGGYKTVFEKGIANIQNATYHGLLDLRKNEGYDILSTYHTMLFPSYWKGEGFAGVFIDAFIAGLPVLASDWAHNAESVINGNLGVIYPVHNVDALVDVMENCIMGKIDLETMARNAHAEAPKYSAEKALSKEYLQSIGLIE